MLLNLILTALAIVLRASPAAVGGPAFTYNRTHFLLHGAPYQIIGGQMDPQRIPRAYWRDRLRMARAMGLNTVFPYVFWNLLEPAQGQWRNTGDNDIAAFVRIAQEEGLNIVLRPGPYICGERDWGGFPAWLATVPGMVVRSKNGPFLHAAETYVQRLADDLRSLTASRGGPVLMVQVENEYGSYGNDHDYTAAIRDMLRANFDTVLYTNDGTEQWTLDGGSVPGVLAEIDGDPRAGFEALRQYVTDPSQQGPLLDGEYYTYGPDIWGAANAHTTSQGRAQVVRQFVQDIDYALGNESASLSMYMAHGGTNFGWGNGALWQDKLKAWTTSYDYGSPIDESGRSTDLYHTLRSTIQKYVPEGSIPEVPPDVPRMAVPQFPLAPMGGLFDAVRHTVITKSAPFTMEALDQAYGFTLYEHVANSSVSGLLRPGDRPRDRVLVYVDGVRQGVIDSQYQEPLAVTVQLKPGSKLQLLVENLGRVNYYSRGTNNRNDLQDPYKGIRGNVTVGGRVLNGWEMSPLPLDDVSDLRNLSVSSSNATLPTFYRGYFVVDHPSNAVTALLDTFLALPNGVRGNVWVNGYHLGRYWRVGPQQSLYLPGTVVRANHQQNEVTVLELAPHLAKGPMVAIGQSDRTWSSEPDEECPNCI